jgi:hypothetical protein
MIPLTRFCWILPADGEDFGSDVLMGFQYYGTFSSIFADADLAEKLREEEPW